MRARHFDRFLFLWALGSAWCPLYRNLYSVLYSFRFRRSGASAPIFSSRELQEMMTYTFVLSRNYTSPETDHILSTNACTFKARTLAVEILTRTFFLFLSVVTPNSSNVSISGVITEDQVRKREMRLLKNRSVYTMKLFATKTSIVRAGFFKMRQLLRI